MSNHETPTLDGVPLCTLQAWLLAAQTAMNDFMTGKQIVDASYQQGDGMKRVTYRRDGNGLAQLRAYIGELQRAIGVLTGNDCAGRRRALRVGFR